MPTLVLSPLSGRLQGKAETVLKGSCSQIQVSLAELQKDKCIKCIIPWPILDGKLDEVI